MGGGLNVFFRRFRRKRVQTPAEEHEKAGYKWNPSNMYPATSPAAVAAPGQTSLAAVAALGQTSPAAVAALGQTSLAAVAALGQTSLAAVAALGQTSPAAVAESA